MKEISRRSCISGIFCKLSHASRPVWIQFSDISENHHETARDSHSLLLQDPHGLLLHHVLHSERNKQDECLFYEDILTFIILKVIL